MAHSNPALNPRKTPVQARSTATVAAIYGATIQVLMDGGIKKFTTTRVAERAGVSVGTLYQYFPNKTALLAAMLEQYLTLIVEAVETACVASHGLPLSRIAHHTVNAFVDAKLRNLQASLALYAVASEVGGDDIVRRLTERSQVALCQVLASAPDAQLAELPTVAMMLSTAMAGPVQAVLAAGAPPPMVQALRTHMVAMADAYLWRVAQAGNPGPKE